MKCPHCGKHIIHDSATKMWRARKAALGLCQRCGQEPSVSNTTACQKCTRKHADNMRMRRA